MENKNCRFAIDSSKGHELKDGTYPIVLYVTKENKRKTITTLFSAMPEQWDSKGQSFQVDNRFSQIKLHPKRKSNNTWLTAKKVLCDKIIKDFDEHRIDWTLNQFEEEFTNIRRKSNVKDFFEQSIAKLKRSGHIGNMRCYSQCLHVLELFDAKFDKKVFNEIDKVYVRKFHDYLYIDRGCSLNTIRYYMKALRAIINKAIEAKEGSAVTYPFGKLGYQIEGEETQKRYLTSVDLEKLKNKPLEDYHLNLYRNIFLFSYYCQGMSFIDVSHLKKSNIHKLETGSYIVYRRQKTEGKNTKAISIKITEQIQNLLDWFKAETPLIGDYLVPCITIEGHEGEKLYQHIKDRVHRFNKNLKTVAEELKIEGITLTTYVARHSYAMRLKNSGISEDVISQALGHKDLKTTKTYLDSFGNEVVDKANEVL
ncbi:MAG: site-specific integrase [Prolixibacteraceae bacterium]